MNGGQLARIVIDAIAGNDAVIAGRCGGGSSYVQVANRITLNARRYAKYDARRESADAEGSRGSEIAVRPRRERASDCHHDRVEPVDGRRVSQARRRYRHHAAGARGIGRCRPGAA